MGTWPGATGAPNEAYVNGLPRARQRTREARPASPMQKATSLVRPAEAYSERTRAGSAGDLAAVTTFAWPA